MLKTFGYLTSSKTDMGPRFRRVELKSDSDLTIDLIINAETDIHAYS